MFTNAAVNGVPVYRLPAIRLVMVHTAVHTQASDPNLETLALWRGVVATLGAR